MHLVLRAVTLSGAPLTQTLSGRFDERGGTLGRSDENTLTLPDPKRHISRQQAEVSLSPRGYCICNIGSANPIVLNDRPVAPGESAVLADGDELLIGAYLLRVSVTPDEDAAAITLARPPSPPAAQLPSDFSFASAPPAVDPWGGDPLEMLHPVGSAHGRSLDPLLGPDRGGDVLQRFLNPGAAAAPGPASAAARPPGAPSSAGLAELLLPGLRAAPEAPLPAAAFIDRTPDLHAAMPLPRPLSEVPAATARGDVDIEVEVTHPVPLMPSGATDRAPDRATDPQALWAAFCEGTGVPLSPPQGLNPQLMRVIGQLLRHLVGGTVQLVRLRAETKNELRFPATMLGTQGNNPLRYSPNVQAALTQVLQPPLSGFMAGPEAAQDAMDDLFAHAIGTMTGMRAAIEGVLTRFEPPRLEAQITGSQVLDTLLPMHRRARLWDLYLQHFDGVRSEAQEDFDRLFGQAFVGAYEAQLDKLDAERRARRRRAGP